jgi:hypothetical protein
MTLEPAYSDPTNSTVGASMSLSDLAALGSFVSGGAVLVSLVFLYFQLRQLAQQVRQAEKNQQAAIRQGRSATGIEIALAPIDAELARALVSTANAGEGLTDVQVVQFLSLTRAVFINYEDAFYQHQNGLLDDVAFEVWTRTARSGLGSAARRVAWGWLRGGFGSDFGLFIDQVIAETPLVQPFVRAERWRSDLAAELAKSS